MEMYFFSQSLRCGTTGVVTFIRGNMLHVAWLGDSQVMLVRRGQAVELMKPHKPDREVRRGCPNPPGQYQHRYQPWGSTAMPGSL